MAERVTESRVAKLRPDAKRDVFYWDSGTRGFGVRVTSAGVRSYVAQFRNAQGKSRRITIARCERVTCGAARKEAKRILGEAALGADPAEERRANRERLTVADLGSRYLAEWAEPRKKPRSVYMDRLNLKRHILPALGQRAVAEVTRPDLSRLHHSMRRTPGAANRTLALCSKMFNLAELWGLRPDGSNPTRHIERYPERKYERFLCEEELSRLGAALDQAEREKLVSPAAVAALRLLVLTGCRLSEVLTLRWEYISIKRGVIDFPDSKTGRKSIPLNSAAAEVLRGIPRNIHGWVIPGLRPGAHLVNITKPWQKIRKLADLDGLRLHDLRHTYASIGAGAGLGLSVVGRLLGHSSVTTTERYAHFADDPVRAASEEIGARLQRGLEGRA